MYNTLLRMWRMGKIDEAGIDKAVSRHWINAEEAKRIKAYPKNV